MSELAVSGAEGLDDEATAEINKLESEIASKRRRVVASLGELRRRVDGATSWRHWVKAHPFVCIAAATSLGFFLGYRGGGKSR